MYLDHKNPDSIASNTRTVRETLADLRKQARSWPSRSHRTMDVRLVANADGECWFAVGDVQYDTVHGAACEAIEISDTSTNDELDAAAKELMDGVVDQLAESEVE